MCRRLERRLNYAPSSKNCTTHNLRNCRIAGPDRFSFAEPAAKTQVKQKPAFIYCIDWTYLTPFPKVDKVSGVIRRRKDPTFLLGETMAISDLGADTLGSLNKQTTQSRTTASRRTVLKGLAAGAVLGPASALTGGAAHAAAGYHLAVVDQNSKTVRIYDRNAQRWNDDAVIWSFEGKEPWLGKKWWTDLSDVKIRKTQAGGADRAGLRLRRCRRDRPDQARPAHRLRQRPDLAGLPGRQPALHREDPAQRLDPHRQFEGREEPPALLPEERGQDQRLRQL